MIWYGAHKWYIFTMDPTSEVSLVWLLQERILDYESHKSGIYTIQYCRSYSTIIILPQTCLSTMTILLHWY
jgi:hypothetical protein